jgi:DNA modification methylase
MSNIQLMHGDCLDLLRDMEPATMIWADPPDNIGVQYESYSDDLPPRKYAAWLWDIFIEARTKGEIFWLSYNAKWMPIVLRYASMCPNWRQFFWHYTFGQNRQSDFVSSYRPILRLMTSDAVTYPDAIRVPSARQTKYKDKRANPKGKMPDDVWAYPRVCGTFKERKKWIPNQHPKDLLRRLVLFSTKPGDLVIDMFAGSGNMLEVCRELNRRCIGIEISKTYCDHIREDLGI